MSLKMLGILAITFITIMTVTVEAKNSDYTIAELVDRLEKQEKRIQLLERTISSASTDKFQKETYFRSDNVSDFWSSYSVQQRIANNKRDIPGSSICSFYVLLSHDLHLNIDAPLVFDNVKLNENNCYNTGDGLFVPDLDGIYVFHWKITTHGGGVAGVSIKKNGQIVGMSLLVRSDKSNIVHNSASDFAILRLQTGDHVILASSIDNAFVHAGHSGFGGFFLTE